MVARLRGRPTPQPPEEPPVEESTSPESSGSGTSKLLIAITVLSLLAAAGAGGYAYYQRGTGTAGASAESHSGSGHAAATADTTGPIHNLGPFVVNLGDLNAQHYLRIAVSLDFKVSDSHFVGQSASNRDHWLDDFKATLKQKEPVLKDVMVTTLSSRAPESLNTLPGKEDLKAELTARFNQHFDENAVVHQLYFTDFVIQ